MSKGRPLGHDKKLLDRLIPQQSRRRLLASILRTVVTNPRGFKHRFNRENFFLRRQFQSCSFTCNICGTQGYPTYDMPDCRVRRDYGNVLLRETLRCTECGSTMRQRAFGEILLREISRRGVKTAITVHDLSSADLGLEVLDTDSFSPLSARLCQLPGYIRSKFLPSKPFGIELEPGIFNINLERIDFPSDRFDLILTSDVMEHVRDDDAAHREIWRCLKPGGAYIFTVPFIREMVSTRKLVDTSTDRNIYLCYPHLHGDPLSRGVLAYRIYGQQIISELMTVGFAVEYEEMTSVERAIFQAGTFIARKPLAPKPR